MSIQWNEKADKFTSPMQRDAFERGQAPRRLDGRLSTDEHGNVWFSHQGSHRIIGHGAAPTLADKQIDDGAPDTRDLTPPKKSRKRIRR
jgi:hypothetical protein